MDDLKGPAGPDGCGVTFSSDYYYEDGTKVGTKIIFKRDCPNNPSQNGTTLGNIIVRDGAAGEGGDVTEEQILNALEHSNAFAQKADRSQLNDYLMKTDAANTYATQSQFNVLSSTVAGHTNLLSDLDGKTVKQYVDENTPTFRMEKDNTTGKWYICKSGNCTGNPPSGTGWEEFDMNVDLGNYYTKTESNDLFALKTSIGDLGNKTVKQYVDTNIETVNATLADKASQTDMDAVESILSGFGGTGQPQTVKQYVDDHTTSIIVKPSSDGNDTYICTGDDCVTYASRPEADPGDNWTKLNVDLTSINSEIESLKTDKADKRELDDYLKTTDAASTYLTQTGAANMYATKTELTSVLNKADAAQADATTALNKFGDLGNQTTVRSYVDNAVSGLATETYVDNKVATVRPTIMTETYQGTTYICSSGNCTNHAPGEGWEELSVNLDVLEGFGGTGEPQKVKGYIDTELDKKLDKTDIKLTREGDSIKISGGGIESSYEVANVTDLMCKSYEVEQRELTGEKVTYELKCITSDE